SSPVSINSNFSPFSDRISTFNPKLLISLTSTLKDSGILGASIDSPLTIASYAFTLPKTSSDFIVNYNYRTAGVINSPT
ncbi:unnamed protein product, partial [marine sediment metagenome]